MQRDKDPRSRKNARSQNQQAIMTLLRDSNSKLNRLLGYFKETKEQRTETRVFFQSSKDYEYKEKMMFEKSEISHDELLFYIKAKKEQIFGFKH